MDSQMKNLHATAQVASQQGVYLADCFNRMEKCEKDPEGPIRFRGEGRHRFRPFRYKHLGQFAPLGGEQTAAQLPGDWVSIGHSTQWLWYSVYAR
ncbi:PREDICTED: external alternative NAD(P)H-ubiquinone oxidoreductase B4, mitochondrial-like [Ipomoea nil]|uniref:external alternative NAD(P)H-ubiquinone oxidoreductase B4, mitochondrial-like n=1 Tax=Ipomoea nil TaxID=35883 RepID=UPI000901E849|nr:PREDICTED: external alternative NAD(P)H-ubiquinone oxidoreductase B4, mitochondrial-like [Ipomoea nil]